MRRLSLFFVCLLSGLLVCLPVLTTGGFARAVQSEAPIATGPVPWKVYHQGLKLAKQQRKHVFVQFFATWCGYCRKMDSDFGRTPRLRQVMAQHFIPVRITEDSKTPVVYRGKSRPEGALIEIFQISAYPTLVFLKPDGSKLATLPGYLEPDELYGLMLFVGTSAYQQMDFEQFKSKGLAK